jgi:hypothetical protein
VLFNDIARSRPPSAAIGESTTFILFLPEKLFEKAPRGYLDKRLRLLVCQDNHACFGGWSQHDRSTEARILAVMINQMHAANVSSEPAERIVQVLGTSGRPPVHPDVNLWAMQLCHHLYRDYPVPEFSSVVELQQRVPRHFIDACIDATTRP